MCSKHALQSDTDQAEPNCSKAHVPARATVKAEAPTRHGGRPHPAAGPHTPPSLRDFTPLGCFTRMPFQTSLLPLNVFILKEGPQRLQIPATRQVGVPRQNHAEARRGYPGCPKLLHREAATGTGDRQLLSHGSRRIPREIDNQVPLMTQYTAAQSKLPRDRLHWSSVRGALVPRHRAWSWHSARWWHYGSLLN